MPPRKLLFLLLAIGLLTQCNDNANAPTPVKTNPDFIVAADSGSFAYFGLNVLLENDAVADTSDATIEIGTAFVEAIPLNIDNDNAFDLRYGDGFISFDKELISKGFFMSDNGDNLKGLEFAIDKKGAISFHDSIMLITHFNAFDTINAHQRWIESKNEQSYYLSYSCNYGDLQESIHGTVDDKYIGLRMKDGDKYIYGWIRFSIYNHEKLRLYGSTFAHY